MSLKECVDGVLTWITANEYHDELSDDDDHDDDDDDDELSDDDDGVGDYDEW